MNMQQVIRSFKTNDFNKASVDFFKYLNVPINQLIEDRLDINDLLGENKTFEIVDTTYMIGGIDDNVFQDRNTKIELKPQRYDGLLIFAININIPNPTRAQLSNISRIFNRKFEYTPVVILFKYDNKLSLSNTQRQEYSENQKWRDGEKVGKVSILRDIKIINPHRGHIDILEKMKLPSNINNYELLYNYWQKVFDVSVLNEKFYKELQHWYFYAINEVTYPSEPKRTDPNYSDELRKEYTAKNIIRLLTRLLFVWFMKEKGLIPNKLFEESEIKDILKEFDPKKLNTDTLFSGQDKRSFYYKAILQNLFFATLNQEMTKRRFIKDENRHKNITNLMRYEHCFKSPSEFVRLLEEVVPFMNGGLFECLENEDGFLDKNSNELVVPDYIFFGLDEHVDLSLEYGSKNKAFKDASVKGLINILNSYKFTVAENTPIEEDVALDPELLGKVFENLLASYNPETKTTARKQTGSFYTPREIVSYMVDESLIVYLKTKFEDYEDKEELDIKLHKLLAYDDSQPFKDEKTILKIINAIDTVKILDPAVGSGAFPMGILQKMVHLLHKLDPNNKYWFDLQLEKVHKQTDELFKTNNKKIQEEKRKEIDDTFDETINHPDYARKLYLIENSIFGVDIQPIAIQISKLRFFISLVVEQNVNNDKYNFGIRPLPNLESKFVTANTLIGIDKKVDNLFEFDDKIKTLEDKLKIVRHKIFNTKVPKRKIELKEEDKNLREHIAKELISAGFETTTAKMLSDWDPYDQNASSPFFDKEWMFGITDGFDIVIGNPPYVSYYSKSQNIAYQTRNIIDELKKHYSYIQNKKAKGRLNSMNFFIEKGLELLSNNGVEFLILDIALNEKASIDIRDYITNNFSIKDIIYGVSVFENVTSDQIILGVSKNKINDNKFNWRDNFYSNIRKIKQSEISFKSNYSFYFSEYENILKRLDNYNNLSEYVDHTIGVQIGGKNLFYNGKAIKDLFYSNLKSLNSYENITSISKYEKPIIDGFLEFNIELGRDINRSVKDANIALPNNLPFVNEEKIILRQSSSILTATISNRETTGEHKFFFFKLKDDSSLSLKFILALINSKLMTFYALQRSIIKTGEKKQPQIRIKEFIKIPIKDITKQEQDVFINMVDYIMFSKLTDELISKKIELVLDGMIYELYFSEHMKEKQINIIEFVKKDLQNIFQDKVFENLNGLEKSEKIKELFSKWIDPDNEVRNRLKLFAVRSPEILAPILELS